MSEITRFQVGELVRHRRYGYRGVVAGHDETCQASEEWHRSNLTQPDRRQPWYHVLVHGAKHTTYAAEGNLEPDGGGEQVVHPFTKVLFENFVKGRYQPRENVRFADLF